MKIVPLILFFTSFVNLFLGFFVLRKNHKSATGIYFFLLTLSLSFWIFFHGFTALSKGEEIALLSTRISLVGAIFLPSIYLFLTQIFPFAEAKLFDKSLYLHGLIVFILVMFLPTKYFIESVIITSKDVEFRGGIIYTLFSAYFIAVVLFGLLILCKRYLESTSTLKNHLKYFIFGALAQTITGVIFSIVLPFFNYYKLNRLGPTGTIIFVSVTAYAITKHELMDIRVMISRTVAYGFVGILLVASFIGLNALRMPIPLTMATNALLALFWAFAAHRLRDFIQTPLEEKWITGWYDPNKLMNQIAQKLVPIMERKEAFGIIAEGLKQSIKIKQIDIITNSTELKALADEGLKKDILRLKDKLLIPLTSSDSLEGVLALSPKISEDPYNEKDLILFRTLQLQVLAVLDRIYNYQERLQAQKQLLWADKLSSLGRVAAGMAHEIKNPLAAIKGMTQAIDRNPDDSEILADFKEVVPKEIDRLNHLVENLVRLGRTPKLQFLSVNVNGLIENTLKLFENRCRNRNITIAKDLVTTLSEVKADPEQLTQVFTNLILNAIDAMPGGGQLKFSTQPLADKIIIEVSDTGQGISEDKLKNIFEPFFSTKEEGSGLGLAITYKIIKDHKGEVEVESKVGEGTRFRVVLPTRSFD